jgi:hypothetical protein
VKFRVIQVFHSPRCPEFTYWASAERRRLLFSNERCSEITAMRSQWGYGSPVGLDCPRSRGRVAGDEREHRRRFDSPAECRVSERGQWQRSRGDEGKAVGLASRRLCCLSATRGVRAASRGRQRQKEICGSDRKTKNAYRSPLPGPAKLKMKKEKRDTSCPRNFFWLRSDPAATGFPIINGHCQQSVELMRSERPNHWSKPDL